MDSQEKKLDLPALQQYLQDSETITDHHFFEQFSDLSESDISGFLPIWRSATTQRKLEFIESLEETAASDMLVSYESLGMALLHEPEAIIRKAGIDLLSESEDYRLALELLRMAKQDDDLYVQAAAVKALGTFVYLGELDKFSAQKKEAIESYLLEVIHSDAIDFKKQRALEALGFSCNEKVPQLIQNALDKNDQEWLTSALIAMGRSADEQWEPHILEVLDHPDTEIQMEAIRAAGELELQAAAEFLIDLLETSEELDYEMFSTIVWSLSQIGGTRAIETINALLDNAEIPEEIEFLETALDNLELKQSVDSLDFFSFDPSVDHYHPVDFDDQNDENDDEDDEEEDFT
jgi:HEAT repeat protein